MTAKKPGAKARGARADTRPVVSAIELAQVVRRSSPTEDYAIGLCSCGALIPSVLWSQSGVQTPEALAHKKHGFIFRVPGLGRHDRAAPYLEAIRLWASTTAARTIPDSAASAADLHHLHEVAEHPDQAGDLLSSDQSEALWDALLCMAYEMATSWLATLVTTYETGFQVPDLGLAPQARTLAQTLQVVNLADTSVQVHVPAIAVPALTPAAPAKAGKAAKEAKQAKEAKEVKVVQWALIE